MTDLPETPAVQPVPAPVEPTSGPTSATLVEQHPELPVGAAFAGGFVLAMILKRLAR